MNRRPHPGGPFLSTGHHRWGLLLLLLALLAVAALTAYLVARRTRPHLAGTGRPAQAFGGSDRALDIARFRYANGELSREAYLQIVGDLGGAPYAAPAPPSPPPPPTSPE
jgi:uncharacterized membrane protein